MTWNQELTNLRDVLSGLYLTINSIIRIVDQAGLNLAYIDFNGTPNNVWHGILKEATLHDKVSAIIDIALKEYPENDWLKLAQQGKLLTVKGPDINDDVVWKGPDDSSQLEKIIGKRSTILPISFLEIGLKTSRSVVRIELEDGSSGSGFLTPNNLIMTNNHVIKTKSVAKEAKVQFNYQLTPEGRYTSVEEYSLLPQDLFETSEEDDWTVIRVENNPTEKWGALNLNKQDPKVGDHVNIIQHAGGGPKQIALYNNVLLYSDSKIIQYLTDTLPGSSGSPVFDDDWSIVGLHNSGGWLREPKTKKIHYRNQGIHINTIVSSLEEKGIEI